MKRSLPLLPTVLPPVSRRSLAGLAAALLCVAGLSGCVGADGVPRDNTAMLPDDQRVSTLPWNQQQGWENTSKLGALSSDPRLNDGRR